MAFHAFGELDHMEPFSSRLAWRWRAQSVKVSMENYPKGVTKKGLRNFQTPDVELKAQFAPPQNQ